MTEADCLTFFLAGWTFFLGFWFSSSSGSESEPADCFRDLWDLVRLTLVFLAGGTYSSSLSSLGLYPGGIRTSSSLSGGGATLGGSFFAGFWRTDRLLVVDTIRSLVLGILSENQD